MSNLFFKFCSHGEKSINYIEFFMRNFKDCEDIPRREEQSVVMHHSHLNDSKLNPRLLSRRNLGNILFLTLKDNVRVDSERKAVPLQISYVENGLI